MTAGEEQVDVRPLLDDMLAAARAGMERSRWSVGDPADKLLLPVIGALTVFFGERLRVNERPVDETLFRTQIARELRDRAARHPAGTARHGAFLDAANLVERRAQG